MENRTPERGLRVGFAEYLSDEPEQEILLQEPTLSPKSVESLELATTLRAFQLAVYATAAYQLDPEHSRALTAEQKRYFSLSVVGYDTTNSIFSVLTPTNLMAAATVWQAIMLTVQVMNQISTADSADKLSPLARALLRPTATIVRVSERLRRRFVASYTDQDANRSVTFRTSGEANRRILSMANQQSSNQANTAIVLPQVYTYADGVIQDIRIPESIVVVKFPEYTDPTNCYYRPTAATLQFLHRFPLGAHVTVYGEPFRNPWERPDSPPQAIMNADFSLQRDPRLL